MLKWSFVWAGWRPWQQLPWYTNKLAVQVHIEVNAGTGKMNYWGVSHKHLQNSSPTLIDDNTEWTCLVVTVDEYTLWGQSCYNQQVPEISALYYLLDIYGLKTAHLRIMDCLQVVKSFWSMTLWIIMIFRQVMFGFHMSNKTFQDNLGQSAPQAKLDVGKTCWKIDPMLKNDIDKKNDTCIL